MTAVMRFHIFDSGYISRASHHVSYTAAIRNELAARSVPSTVYCPINLDRTLTALTDLVPIFSSPLHHTVRSSWLPRFLRIPLRLLIGNYRCFLDLRRVSSATFRAGDVLFFHTINHTQLAALYAWYLLIPAHTRPRMIILLRYALSHNRGTRPLARLFYRLLLHIFGRTSAAHSIVYVTDSEELASDFAPLLSGRPSVLPIPTVIPGFPKPDTVVRGSNTRLRVAYLGDARDEKGYYLLPEAIRILSRSIGEDKVCFTIQSLLSQHSGAHSRVARDALAADFGHVVLLERELSPEEYIEVLVSADAVVLPYHADSYLARTSGIFSEALTAGKPVIIPEGTWMASQARIYNAGAVEFTSGDAISLAHAMQRFVLQYDALAKRAREAAPSWGRHHNPGICVDRMLCVVSAAHS
ncbi:MAG: glycosyltransferase family protein [Sulfobacillus sp.]